MIQRIQTLYLFLALVAMTLLFFFPMANYVTTSVFATGNEQIFKLFITGLRSMIPGVPVPLGPSATWPLLALGVVTGILILVTLFLFKKRLLQMRMAAVTILVNLALVALIFLFYVSKIETLTSVVPSYQFGIFLPIISLILVVLAYYAIRKDEAMVRAADRLR